MLKVELLSAWYGAAQILYDLSFDVGRGEVVALMGRNGAGKSTTMKAVMGLLAKRRGLVRFNGENISDRKPFEIARRGLGFTPEDRRIFVDLTVMEISTSAVSRHGFSPMARRLRHGRRSSCLHFSPISQKCRIGPVGA